MNKELSGGGGDPKNRWRATAPVKLLRFPRTVNYFDVAPDDTRVLASMSAGDAAGRTIGVIFDWDAAGP